MFWFIIACLCAVVIFCYVCGAILLFKLLAFLFGVAGTIAATIINIIFWGFFISYAILCFIKQRKEA